MSQKLEPTSSFTSIDLPTWAVNRVQKGAIGQEYKDAVEAILTTIWEQKYVE